MTTDRNHDEWADLTHRLFGNNQPITLDNATSQDQRDEWADVTRQLFGTGTSQDADTPAPNPATGNVVPIEGGNPRPPSKPVTPEAIALAELFVKDQPDWFH